MYQNNYNNKIDRRSKQMDYLTVDREDYLCPPTRSLHKRSARSVSPALKTHLSMDDGLASLPEIKKSLSTRSLLVLHNFDSKVDLNTSTNDSLKLDKSHESLCFGMARKKSHRQAHINEMYRPRCNTDPGLKEDENHLKVPVLSIPVAVSATNTPISTPVIKRKFGMNKNETTAVTKSALTLLIEQSLKLTTASMGLQAANRNKLSQQSPRPFNDDNVKRRFSRSTSSVSTLAATSIDTTSMAPLQSHTEAHSVTCLNTLDQGSNLIEYRQQPQQPQQQVDDNNIQKHYRHLSTPVSTQSDNYSTANSNSIDASYQNLTSLRNSTPEARTLKHNPSLLNPQVSVDSSIVSIRSISPSRKSASCNSISNTTAKHEQSATAAAAAAATTPPEKEKKRKEVSSSRVKKFHRHFTQVSKDEKLINYFSCALVSDILLQGHLYITDQHFAFYSNVFGYVTKVVIPTSSVTKISKEKTAKIIPNAVGVATADERHVFGSFISREAAFRLMCSVCPPLAPAEIIAKIPVDIEISEEYSIEDDSSCSISGNESPPQALKALATANGVEEKHTLLKRNVASSSLNLTDAKSAANEKLRNTDIPANAKNNLNFAHHPTAGVRASAPPAARLNNNSTSSNSSMTPPNTVLPLNIITAASLLSTPTTGAAASAATNLTMIIAGTASSTTTSTTSASSTPTPSTSSSPTTVMATPKSAAQAAADSFRMFSKNALLRLKFPTELHVVYLGVMLTIVLALFSVFLLYRILDIEAKTISYRSPVEFNWRSGNDEDIFNEALRWQKELQTKSTEEAQNILTTNLEQIAKVRRSLETLSMLIHDRSSAYANRDDSD